MSSQDSNQTNEPVFIGTMSDYIESRLIDLNMALDPVESMTCDEYLEGLDFGSLIDELYWSGGCNTELMFHYMIRHANERRVQLTNVKTWSYDGPMWAVYQNAEKGLS